MVGRNTSKRPSVVIFRVRLDFHAIGTGTEPRCDHLGRRPEEVHLCWFFMLSSVTSS